MQKSEFKKSKLVVGVALVVVGVVLLVWSLAGKGAEAPANESSQRSNESTSQQSTTGKPDKSVLTNNTAQPAEIVFTNDGFSPAELEVTAGTVVTVRNSASTDVQFSSDDHPTHRINQGMNLQILKPGESATFIAEKVGEWGFHDHLDASFTGVLTVTQ